MALQNSASSFEIFILGHIVVLRPEPEQVAPRCFFETISHSPLTTSLEVSIRNSNPSADMTASLFDNSTAATIGNELARFWRTPVNSSISFPSSQFFEPYYLSAYFLDPFILFSSEVSYFTVFSPFSLDFFLKVI